MAQVTGVTPAKLDDIETQMDESVVSANVDASGQLLLTTRGGAVLMAGEVGTGGGTGSDAGAVDESVVITFPGPDTKWVCDHNLNHRYVDVTTTLPDGTVVQGDITYVNANTCTIKWYFPTAGTAVIER